MSQLRNSNFMNAISLVRFLIRRCNRVVRKIKPGRGKFGGELLCGFAGTISNFKLSFVQYPRRTPTAHP
jgi:hypothetical protein